MERLTVPDVRVDEHTTRRSIIDGNAVREHAMEIYWRLKDYEDTGYAPEEIAKLQGDLIMSNAELLKTREELKKHYDISCAARVCNFVENGAKMDGGAEDASV